MEEVNTQQSDFIFNETTVNCFSVGLKSPQNILQITPSHLNLLSYEGKQIKRVNIKEGFSHEIIGVGKDYSLTNDLVFIMLNDG